MTQDRKDDSKGSKEIEKSRKKADSSASISKEKTASSGDGLPTKVTHGMKYMKRRGIGRG